MITDISPILLRREIAREIARALIDQGVRSTASSRPSVSRVRPYSLPML